MLSQVTYSRFGMTMSCFLEDRFYEIIKSKEIQIIFLKGCGWVSGNFQKKTNVVKIISFYQDFSIHIKTKFSYSTQIFIT